MTAMPHLPLMQWDFRDQLEATSRQVVNGGTPETTYYVYDAGGQRVRKVTERQAAAANADRMNERIYLGGFEIYREYDGDGAHGRRSSARRCTSWTTSSASRWWRRARQRRRRLSAAQLIRYQFGNHLGSASLELDDAGADHLLRGVLPLRQHVVSGHGRDDQGGPKRYRYTGKERDEETGLSYHGATVLRAVAGAVDESPTRSALTANVSVRRKPSRRQLRTRQVRGSKTR